MILPCTKCDCRMFDYSSEDLDTGITEIDAIEAEHVIAYFWIINLTLEQSTGVNERFGLESGISNNGDQGVLLEETSGSYLIGETDSSSVGDKYST